MVGYTPKLTRQDREKTKISARGLLAACLCGLVVVLATAPPVRAQAKPAGEVADPTMSPSPSPAASAASLNLQILDPWVLGGDAGRSVDPATIASGAMDPQFHAFAPDQLHRQGGLYWLRLTPARQAAQPLQGAQALPAAQASVSGNGAPVLLLREGHDHRVQVYGPDGPLKRAIELPVFGGAHQIVLLLPPAGPSGPRPVYARVDAPAGGAHVLGFSTSTLEDILKVGAIHSRMIALAFGALAALATGSFLIWCVLEDRVFVLYSALFGLQALYVAFLSGEGFSWPVLAYAVPLNAYAWNVPAALSGAAASLFVREIADLRRFSPRVYAAFGWLSVAFVVLTLANALKPLGFENLVNAIGNIMFVGAAVYTLTVAFIAWRRGSRPAGWFLIAWVLLETSTIATAVELLITDGERGDSLLYSALPLSMVAAAVLTALGVADRLRGQRIALSDAELRAQTDALTGVLNRRSLVERLDSACARAKARGLPISLLFIDLDHFKEINDTFGHPAGDACLAAIVGPIQSELRQSDVIGRYGGEEFVVILSSADAVAARPIAERILRRVADIRVEGYGEPISLTCSIGIATSDTLGVWGQHLIARADAAVYVAKRAGRNRVQFAESAAA